MDQWLRISGRREVRRRDVSGSREFERRVSISLEPKDGQLDLKHTRGCTYLVLTTVDERTIAEFQDLDGENGSRALWVAILESEVWGAIIPHYREHIGICMDWSRCFIDRDEPETDCRVDGVDEGANGFLVGLESRGSGRKEGWESRDKGICL